MNQVEGAKSVRDEDAFDVNAVAAWLGERGVEAEHAEQAFERLDLLALDPLARGEVAEIQLGLLVLDKARDVGRRAAVVHLHSTHSVAVSCLHDVDPKSMLPPLTAYYVMRVGVLPLVPYFAPGDVNLAKAVKEFASKHHAVMLANHGPVVAGVSLEDAVYATEELEETARIFLLLRGERVRVLTKEQVEELRRRFPTTT